MTPGATEIVTVVISGFNSLLLGLMLWVLSDMRSRIERLESRAMHDSIDRHDWMTRHE